MAFRTNKTPVLQEKTASGAVASFNTALAMPLPSCNIAVNAWQEGSGDPSPVNDRPIHGFSEVNATRAGKNLISDYRELVGKYLKDDGEPSGSSTSWDTSPFYPIKENTIYYLSCDNPPTSSQAPRICFYDINKRLISYVDAMANRTISTPSNAVFIRLSLFHPAYNYQLEKSTTPTEYEPYVTSTIYTIQLGQEVYGAEVDVVNGVAHVTYITERIDHVDTVLSSYIKSDACDGFVTLSNCPNIVPADTQYNVLCNYFARAVSEYGIWSRVGYSNKFQTNSTQIHLNIANDLLGITDYTQETTATAKAKMNEWLSNNVVMINRPLKTPFDIQLTPQQIETLIGNNTIFADTGDIDLTYKDLDIAKRGNFREVFKLPS